MLSKDVCLSVRHTPAVTFDSIPHNILLRDSNRESRMVVARWFALSEHSPVSRCFFFRTEPEIAGLSGAKSPRVYSKQTDRHLSSSAYA